MKNRFIYILTLLFLTGASSCTDFLDIKPLNEMVLEDYWKTKGDVESVVLACYRAMEEDAYMERIILGGELRSDNVIVDEAKLRTPSDVVLINDMTIKPNNDLLEWRSFYTVINYCNTVLEYAPGVSEIDPNYTPGFMRAHMAEAYALRALTYFYLVRLYRDVPYIDFPYTDDTQNFIVPQTSGDTILYRMTEQLEVAEKYALKSYGKNALVWQKGRVTKNMIRALLADIYLWLGEYDKCIAACERVEPDIVGENDYIDPDLQTGAELRLVTNGVNGTDNVFRQLFYYGNSEESIFELQFSPTQKMNDKLVSLYGYDTQRQLAAGPFEKYGKEGTESLFDEKDVRGTTFFTPKYESGSAQGFSLIFKYIGQVLSLTADGTIDVALFRNVDLTTPNWIFYRLADIYLMKAEALIERNQGGDLEQALQLINVIYMRSQDSQMPLTPEDNTQETYRSLLLDERQREFLFEGKRWFDLLRLARREDKAGGGADAHPQMLNYVVRKYDYNGEVIKSKLLHTDALYLPVHEDELSKNPALKQNPYYKTTGR
jgi:tetratricopeptide (TPR) repeat protein